MRCPVNNRSALGQAVCVWRKTTERRISVGDVIAFLIRVGIFVTIRIFHVGYAVGEKSRRRLVVARRGGYLAECCVGIVPLLLAHHGFAVDGDRNTVNRAPTRESSIADNHARDLLLNPADEFVIGIELIAIMPVVLVKGDA